MCGPSRTWTYDTAVNGARSKNCTYDYLLTRIILLGWYALLLGYSDQPHALPTELYGHLSFLQVYYIIICKKVKYCRNRIWTYVYWIWTNRARPLHYSAIKGQLVAIKLTEARLARPSYYWCFPSSRQHAAGAVGIEPTTQVRLSLFPERSWDTTATSC